MKKKKREREKRREKKKKLTFKKQAPIDRSKLQGAKNAPAFSLSRSLFLGPLLPLSQEDKRARDSS